MHTQYAEAEAIRELWFYAAIMVASSFQFVCSLLLISWSFL